MSVVFSILSCLQFQHHLLFLPSRRMEQTASTPMSFRLASCNILFESYYSRHCRVPVMPADARIASWQNFAKTQLFASQDVVLLQEFPSGDLSWAGPIEASGKKLVASAQRGDSTAVAYNPETFELLDVSAAGTAVEVHRFPKGKTATRVLFKHRPTGQPVAVVSAHLPWAPDQPTRRTILEELCNFTNGCVPPEFPVFVGGDFNIEANSIPPQDETEKNDVLPAFTRTKGWHHLTEACQWSQMSRSGAVQLDYVFGRWGFLDEHLYQKKTPWDALVRFSIVPDSWKELIKHDRFNEASHGPPFSQYFSDHAFVAVDIGVPAAGSK